MISPLQAFLIENSEAPKEHEVVVSERLKDYPFTIRSLNFAEYDAIRKQSVDHNRDDSPVDGTEVSRNLVISGCIEPDFKDADVLLLDRLLINSCWPVK